MKKAIFIEDAAISKIEEEIFIALVNARVPVISVKGVRGGHPVNVLPHPKTHALARRLVLSALEQISGCEIVAERKAASNDGSTDPVGFGPRSE